MGLRIVLAALAAATLFGSAALAQDDDEPPLGPEGQALHDCALDGASAEQRAAIMRLAFVALAQSPTAKSLARVPPQQVDEVQVGAATAIEDLLLDRCRSELVAVLAAGDRVAVERTAEGLMEAAMGALFEEEEATPVIDGLTERYHPDRWAGLKADLDRAPR